MSRLAAVLLATSLLAGVAHAAVDPRPGKEDPRIRSTPYDPKQVLRLESTGLTPVRVVLESDETIWQAMGPLVVLAKDPGSKEQQEKPTDWYVIHSGSTLLIQPLRPMQPSFMFVRTKSATGNERLYTFELITRDSQGNIAADPRDPKFDKGAYVEVDFTYKHVATPEEIAAARARRDAREAALSEQATNDRLAQAQFSVPRNRNYWKRGKDCPAFMPSRDPVSDDGQQTTILFAQNSEMPNVYQVGSDNKPAILTAVPQSTVDGVLVTLPGVYKHLRLTRVSKVCDIVPGQFDNIGAPPGGGTGTISPDVVRQARVP